MWDCALLFLLAAVATVIFGLMSDAGIASVSASFVAKLCLLLFILCFAIGLFRASRRASPATRPSAVRSRTTKGRRA